MPAQLDLSKLSVRQFAERFRGEMIPLSNTFSYFCASVPMSEEDLKEYLEEPVAALPPAIAGGAAEDFHPAGSVSGARQRAREAARQQRAPAITFRSRSRRRAGSPLPRSLRLGEETVLAFALKDQEVAEYHYRFYHLLATLMGDHWTDDMETGLRRVLREELNADVHGEVDEPSWRLKQALRRTKAAARRQGVSRIRAAILHRHADAVPARHLLRHRRRHRSAPVAQPVSCARRLLALEELFPPPKGYAVFPGAARGAKTGDAALCGIAGFTHSERVPGARTDLKRSRAR